MTFRQAGGFITVADSSTSDRETAGDRLHRALKELDQKQGDEAKRRAAQQQEIQKSIEVVADERTGLLDQVKALEKKIETKSGELRELKAELGKLPDENTEQAQRHQDRLAALGRTLKAEVHTVDEMVDAYSTHTLELARWSQEIESRPELPEHRELIEFASASPETITGLDPVLRRIIEQQLTTAHEIVETYPRPVAPSNTAPVYECVTPRTAGGAVIGVVIPTKPSALDENDRHAQFVANVIAAVCKALLELTDADAPVQCSDVCEHGVVVGSVCSTDALDADLFGVRVEELLSGRDDLAVKIVPINDHDLAVALAGGITKAVEAR